MSMMVPVNSVCAERYDAHEGCDISVRNGVLDLPPLEMPLSKRERSFLELAVRMAETSDVVNKHGAVIVKNSRVLALGVNKWRNPGYYNGRTVGQEDWQDILTVHAEADALSRVSDPDGCEIYIARISQLGAKQLSRPCWRCMSKIESAGIKRMIYTVG